MKKRIFTFAFLAAVVLAGAATGDSLSVTSAAGMGGAAQGTCDGDGQPGPCGLEVVHDNSSIAYVQDDSPNSETIYRAEFLFSPDDISFAGSPSGLRQAIFTAIGPNPRPGVGLCSPVLAFIEAIRCFHLLNFGTTSMYQCFTRGDFCGERDTGPVFFHDAADVDNDNRVKICIEWERGVGTDAGKIRLAVVDDEDSCSGATYGVGNVTNNDVRVDFVRLGTPQLNGFGAGETITYFFDEFASFRTVNP